MPPECLNLQSWVGAVLELELYSNNVGIVCVILAVKFARKKKLDFNSFFLGQFMLAQNPKHTIPDWQEHKLAKWTLWRAKGDKTKRIMDQNHNHIGWFLGEGVAKSGKYINDPFVLPYDPSNLDSWQNAEAEIEAVAGRYLAILDMPNLQRIYGDPVGDFSAVFNKDERIVASTTLLALTRNVIWNPNFDRSRVLDGKMHFSLQETADISLKRTLPNHYLCLDTFTCMRHWPKHDTALLQPKISFEKNLDEISQRLGDVVGALAKNQKIILPLSGGRDSRNILGASRQYVKNIQFAFSYQYHKMSRIDADIAEIVCNNIGIPFKRIRFDSSMRHDRQDKFNYYNRTGYADSGIGVRITRLEYAVPGNMISLRGNVMELLRANQWRPDIAKTGRLRTSFGIKRLRIDTEVHTPEIVEKWGGKYEKWQETLPKNAKPRSLDLAFLEHLLPNTLGVRHFGNTNNFIMNPFADRGIIQLCIQIPPEIRSADLPNKYLLNHNCSDLNHIPFTGEVASNGSLLDKFSLLAK